MTLMIKSSTFAKSNDNQTVIFLMPLTVEHDLNCVYILKGKVNSTFIRLSFQFAYRFIVV